MVCKNCLNHLNNADNRNQIHIPVKMKPIGKWRKGNRIPEDVYQGQEETCQCQRARPFKLLSFPTAFNIPDQECQGDDWN